MPIPEGLQAFKAGPGQFHNTPVASKILDRVELWARSNGLTTVCHGGLAAVHRSLQGHAAKSNLPAVLGNGSFVP